MDLKKAALHIIEKGLVLFAFYSHGSLTIALIHPIAVNLNKTWLNQPASL